MDDEDEDDDGRAVPARDAGRAAAQATRKRVHCAAPRAPRRAPALRAPSAPRCCTRACRRPALDLYEVQPGDELLFRRAGVPETVLRRLRRGLYRVESRDRPARPDRDRGGGAARRTSCAWRAQRQLRCVRVIHGKGLRSGSARAGAQEHSSTRCCAEPIRCSPSPRRARSPAAPARRWCCCKRAESPQPPLRAPDAHRSARSPSPPALRCGR